MSAPAFRLKGGGWYETDFKGDGEKKRNLVETSSGESSERARRRPRRQERRDLESGRRREGDQEARREARRERGQEAAQDARRRRIRENLMRLRRYLVAGLLIWLPVGVTILVFKVLLDLMDELLFLVPVAYRPETLLGFRIPGLGAILALIVLFLTGVLAANLLGRQLVVWYEAALTRIPLVRTVYGAVKSFAAIVLSGSSFKKVLLIEYPRKGVYRIGLQTSEAAHEIQARPAKTS